MKIKLNWGHGIFIFYLVFVSAVLSVLIASFRVDHALVVDDYYVHDINYQSTYNKKKNAQLTKNVNVRLNQGTLEVYFPDEGKISGDISFYRASDKSLDFSIKIDSARKEIETSGLQSGKWQVKIDWTQNNKSYYFEEEIFLHP